MSAISISSGKFIGGTVGAVYGTFFDVCYSKTIGINILLFSMLGVVSGHLVNKVSKDNKMSLAIMVFAGTIIFEAIYGLCTYFFSSSFSATYFAKVIILEEIYNLFLTYVFFRIFMFWGDILNKSRNNYYTLG